MRAYLHNDSRFDGPLISYNVPTYVQCIYTMYTMYV